MQIWICTPLLRMGKLASWLASHTTSSFIHMIHQVGKMTFWCQFEMTIWAHFVRNLWQLAYVCEKPTGFSEIPRILSTKINRGNKLPAFVLLKWSVNHFPFINHKTLSLALSYHRSITKFRVNSIYIKKQFCMRTVCVLEFAFKTSVQLKLSFKFGIMGCWYWWFSIGPTKFNVDDVNSKGYHQSCTVITRQEWQENFLLQTSPC